METHCRTLQTEGLCKTRKNLVVRRIAKMDYQRDTYRYPRSLAGGILYCTRARMQYIISPRGRQPEAEIFLYSTRRRAPRARVLYDFTARMHEDDIVYIHQRAQRAGMALKTKYSPLVDIQCLAIMTLLFCYPFALLPQSSICHK